MRNLIILIIFLTITILSGCLSEGIHDYPDALADLNPSTGYISGKVLDAYSGYAILGIKVTVYDEWGKEGISITTKSDGSFKLPVRPEYGYFLEFSRYAYIMDIYYGIDVSKGQTTYLNDLKLVPQKYSGSCLLKGKIYADDGVSPITGARIIIRRGAGQTTAPTHVQAHDWTLTDGSFEFKDLAARNYTLEIIHVGYDTVFQTVPCFTGVSVEDLSINLKKEDIDGKVRISLNWSNRVKDLDSHITGPQYSPQFVGGRFHVFYENKHFWEDGFESLLDEDIKESFGTENIIIDPIKSGDYIYYVHNYKNADLPYPVALKNSGALVTLYYNGKTREFSPPQKDGNLWVVFRIRNGTVELIDEIIDESSAANVKRHDIQYISN